MDCNTSINTYNLLPAKLFKPLLSPLIYSLTRMETKGTRNVYILKLFTSGQRDDIVTFSFQDSVEDVSSIKSLLIGVSPVFETMFSKTWNEKDVLELDDDVHFNRHQAFQEFIECIHAVLHLNILSLKHLLGVYFYAEKYQVKSVKDEIIYHLPQSVGNSIYIFRQTVESATKLNLTEFVSHLDTDVGIEIKNGSSLDIQEWYVLCQEYDMNNKMSEVVAAACNKMFLPSWPFELMSKVQKHLLNANLRLDKEVKNAQFTVKLDKDEVSSSNYDSLDDIIEKDNEELVNKKAKRVRVLESSASEDELSNSGITTKKTKTVSSTKISMNKMETKEMHNCSLLKLFTNAKSNDVVTFSFQDSLNVVRSIKSVLVNVSPVFETMFSTTWNVKDVIELNDDVDFNRHEAFLAFIENIHGVQDFKLLPLERLIGVYYYAEKYQIKQFKDEIIGLLPNCSNNTLHIFRETVESASKLNLTEFVTLMDTDVVIDVKNGSSSDIQEWYVLCEKHDLKNQMNEVVVAARHKLFLQSWPFDLMSKVQEMNRDDREMFETAKKSLLCKVCRGSVMFDDDEFERGDDDDGSDVEEEEESDDDSSAYDTNDRDDDLLERSTSEEESMAKGGKK